MISEKCPWLVLAVVSAALFLVVVDMTVLNVALPVLAHELNSTSAEKLWMVNTYSLVLAGLLPGCGTLSDRVGHRKVFTAGLIIFGLASFTASFATSSGWLISARGVLAVGAAMMLPATMSIIRGSTPEPPKFPLCQFQSGYQCIQIDKFIAALEGVMPVQQNVLPGHR
ncbi:MFS transporter [Salmonella enterica]|nr:MFS transporter [Salmonella enterica]EMB8653277.1 MFS transporter [Salmonella enterica]